MSQQVVDAAMKYYDEMIKTPEGQWAVWREERGRFTKKRASIFFVEIMLDQGMIAERALEGADHLLNTYFCDNDSIWETIAATHSNRLKWICQKGWENTPYALHYNYNKFHLRLKSAAERMIEEYEGDPRKIWNVSPEKLSLIYDRFMEFDGIGDALAKMAQFRLAREYGVAGGVKKKHLMQIKPDTLVCRVLYRAGVSPTQKTNDAMRSVVDLSLSSPADFDAAIWDIGRRFCEKTNPKCESCKIRRVCEKVGL